MSSNSYLYRVYGIHVRSEIRFWEFSEIEGEEDSHARWADVTFGAVPETLEGGGRLASWIMIRGNECLFSVKDKGRILVSSGDRIAVYLEEARFEEDIKPYLTIAGFTTLAHQRGLIPLHVSALRSDRGVFLFAGQSGAGKSTIAATLNARYGWKILCDDLAVLDTSNMRANKGPAMLHFGMNKIKLWDDAAQTLGIPTEGVQRDYFRPNKLHVPVAESDPIPFSDVAAVVSLRWGCEVRILDHTPVQGFATLLNSVYPPTLVGPVSDPNKIRADIAKLSGGVRAIIFERTKSEATNEWLVRLHDAIAK